MHQSISDTKPQAKSMLAPSIVLTKILNYHQVPICAILWYIVVEQDHSTRGRVKRFREPPVLLEPTRFAQKSTQL